MASTMAFCTVSDQTKFGKVTWEDIKKSVCSSDAYIGEAWY